MQHIGNINHSWPVAILVNFGASPRAQIERFYNNNGVIEVF